MGTRAIEGILQDRFGALVLLPAFVFRAHVDVGDDDVCRGYDEGFEAEGMDEGFGCV